MADVEGSTILVTGGAGFIGSYVVEELCRLGAAKVRVLDNMVRGSRANLASVAGSRAVELIEGDMRDRALLARCVAGSDYVFHMAALRINACAADPREGFEVMLRATFDLAELCVEHRVRRVIYSSSASVYGLSPRFPTDEACNPYDNRTFYGAAKLWGEQLFRSYQDRYGLEHVALRYFNVYGPRMDRAGRYTEVMIKWLDCVRDGRSPVIFGDGSTTVDLVFVRDVARANAAALTGDVTNEVFNIGSGRETSLAELLAALLAVNGSRLQPAYQAADTVNPVARRLASIDKARALLGFTPEVDLTAGLRALSGWYFGREIGA